MTLWVVRVRVRVMGSNLEIILEQFLLELECETDTTPARAGAFSAARELLRLPRC